MGFEPCDYDRVPGLKIRALYGTLGEIYLGLHSPIFTKSKYKNAQNTQTTMWQVLKHRLFQRRTWKRHYECLTRFSKLAQYKSCNNNNNNNNI